MPMARLTIAESGLELAERSANRFAEIVQDCVDKRGLARVCLTGGTTPKRLYALLATEPWRSRIPWRALQVFWGDERAVEPEHPDSNYGMAYEALIAHVPVPPEQVHRMQGELPPEEAAREYERVLPRRFDLMLLGLGEDAHIASIFPGSPVVHERERRVVAPFARHLNAWRITLTAPALLASTHILMLVEGAEKANAVAAAIEEFDNPDRWPAHVLRAAGDRVEWLIDRSAARALSAPRA
jgi:6-phosphogluconolactonase